jgi:hypothetical protein
MMKMLMFAGFLLCLAGCRSEASRIAAVDVTVAVERLDRELRDAAADSLYTGLPALRERYGLFFEYYNTGIINIGDSKSGLYTEMLQRFMHHEVVRQAYAGVDSVFADSAPLNSALTAAFKHLAYYFPALPLPRLITYVSGFNEAVMLTDSAVGIGLDRFLGSDYALYHQMGMAAYQQYNMRPERIAPIALHSWLSGEFPEHPDNNTLLAKMIYEGKLLYILQKCFPKQPLTLLLGYSPAQLKWCTDNELPIWQYLIEQQLLYTTNPFIIRKYTEEAPFTAGFPQDSPGRAANWTGYRIVCSYVKRTGCSPEALMAQQNPTQLLKDARYNP